MTNVCVTLNTQQSQQILSLTVEPLSKSTSPPIGATMLQCCSVTVL